MQAVLTSLGQGVLAASDLRRHLGVSPATLMRWVRGAGPDVVRIGRGRATRYGLRQPWPSLAAARFPVVRIDDAGRALSGGELVTLAAHETVWLPEGAVSRGLPAELADARPSGFLGRHFAVVHAGLGLPRRPEDWSDHHVLIALSRRGEDLPGDIIIGDESFARWQALADPVATHADYAPLADATIAGHPPGSSAGGDRPKFGAFDGQRHVLVKFAARGSPGDAAARRWCDLLVLESLALAVLSSRGVPAARAQLVDSPSHALLEIERFDRVGERGRRGVASLAAVHDDLADPWARAAVRLREAGRLPAADARRLQWLDAFGALIANTDRHPHNVVFFTGRRGMTLAPAFDQVPMLYAPAADGQVPPRVFTKPPATADTLDVWDEACAAAIDLWRQASDDPRVSDAFRRLAAANARVLAG